MSLKITKLDQFSGVVAWTCYQ